ncbi:MAG: hypothetical protein R6X13_09085, partial [bacterium]
GSGPCALTFNAADNKVYAACYGGNRLAIIDATRDSLRVLLPTGEGPVALCWNPTNDKVYCGVEEGESTLVVDGAGDTAVAALAAGSVTSLLHGPSVNRVYLGGYGGLTVVDGATDSVLGYSGYDVAALCHAAAVGMVWSGAGEQVMARDDSTAQPLYRCLTDFYPQRLCWSPASGKLYCSPTEADAVVVVGGSPPWPSRELFGLANPGALCWDEDDDRVYAAADDGFGGVPAVFGIDCATDSVGPPVHLALRAEELAYGSVGNRVYAGHGFESRLSVVDAGADSLVATLALPGFSMALCYVEGYDRLYCFGGEVLSSVNGGTLVVDSVHGCLITTAALVYAGLPQDKLYIVPNGGSWMHVIDVAQNSFLRVVPGEQMAGLACLNTRSRRLYCAGSSNNLVVFDCVTDTFVGRVALPPGAWPKALAYDSVNNRVYSIGNNARNVSVVDCARDSVVAVIAVGTAEALALDPANLRTFVANRYEATLSVIRDSLRVGVAERSLTPNASRITPAATVIRGILRLPEPGVLPQASSVLLDATGRRVADLKPGENDVSRLAPGVYFVLTPHPFPLPQGERARPSAVTKVIITR